MYYVVAETTHQGTIRRTFHAADIARYALSAFVAAHGGAERAAWIGTTVSVRCTDGAGATVTRKVV